MIRKACFLIGTLVLVGFAMPAAAYPPGTCIVQCNDLTMTSTIEGTASGCYNFGVRFCTDHGGLRALEYQS
ncbi:MAG TPA: hypothetical protein VGH73_14130 [Thermoanaerobaculia bacterium]